MKQGTIHTNIIDRIGYLTFSHPSHNALPGSLLKEMTQSIRRFDQDESIMALVIKSAGERTFCAGAYFDELLSIQNEEQGKSFFMGFADLINALRTCSKIVIGRVQGKAVGGGVGLAAAMDYCLASKWASIKLSELALGLGPFVIGPAVERKMGLSAFSQLSLNAREWQTARWAKEKGLFQEVFDSNEQLNRYVEHFVDQFRNYNPAALKELKKVLWSGTDHWAGLLAERAAISGRLVLSSSAQQSLASFKKKV